ncbi:cell division protein FtsK [Cryptosporangium minutisporangium]|uniref:Cell division protein FtsK n=1 Tax=Cryptosporangium minutisporangium TaxID=113569 RepID=A0ABP6SZK6_9ACTN
MTSPNDQHDPGRFDWNRAENDLNTSTPAVGPDGSTAEVVDLDAARGRRGQVWDTSYEIELDSADQTPLVGELVDAPVIAPEGTRRPIIPVSLRPENLRDTLARFLGQVAYVSGFHAIRSPWYLLQTLWFALRGLLRVVRLQLGWWWVRNHFALLQHTADANDPHEWLKIHREIKSTRLWRGIVLGTEAVTILIGGFIAWALVPRLYLGLALVGALLVLAHVGRPAGRTIIGTAIVAPRFRKLNSDVVLRAYYAAKLGDPDKAGQQIQFGSRMGREGGGSHVLVDLPYGKGLDDAVKARGAIASGMDVALSQVFISRDPSSHRRHVLWVADRDPLALPAGRTPLLRCKPTDIWQPAPFGLDERGNVVSVNLMWTSLLIGAQPRQGKTFAARTLALYAALDPYVKLAVFDGGGKPDWRRFALVADWYAFGLALTRDGDPADILLGFLRWLKAEVQDRYERLSQLPVDVCPEGKLTREIARDPKYRMPVWAVFMDEFQEYFDLGEQSKEIAGLLVYLVKVAPAAGICLVDATQRPSGIGNGQVASQFISFRDNHQVRFALRTGSWQVSDLVLGSGAYSEGFDSSTLLPTYKGVGMLRGASDATPMVRTYLAEAPDAEKILLAARKLREHTGTLSGMAAGEQVARETRDVLADVASVFTVSETGLHWTVIAARLADRIPEHYADLTADAISAQMRALKVPSKDVKRDGQNLKGARAADVRTALERREANGA